MVGCFSISESLEESFDRSYGMYEEAIRDISEDEWKSGEHHNLVPVVIIFHSLEAADFLTGETVEFEWGYRFNIRWQKSDPREFPSQKEMQKYLDEVRTKTYDWLNSFNDEDFLVPDPINEWAGKGRLGRALYLLSHLRQHMGELNAELRHRGIPRVKWK